MLAINVKLPQIKFPLFVLLSDLSLLSALFDVLWNKAQTTFILKTVIWCILLVIYLIFWSRLFKYFKNESQPLTWAFTLCLYFFRRRIFEILAIVNWLFICWCHTVVELCVLNYSKQKGPASLYICSISYIWWDFNLVDIYYILKLLSEPTLFMDAWNVDFNQSKWHNWKVYIIVIIRNL